MATRLLEANYSVAVHNRSQGAVRELASRGAIPCKTAFEVAQKSQVILTMLPDAPEVEEVLLGPEGVLAGAAPGTTVIDMTTNHPDVSARLAERLQEKHIRMLDAPVSGGDMGARHGTLSIMVGGPPETFEACKAILEKLGHKVVHIGPRVGMGGHANLAHQILVSATLAGMSEALVYGAKAGIDPALLVEAMSAGLARCGALDIKAPKVLAGDFKPGEKVDAQVKHLAYVMQMTQQFQLSLPVTTLVHDLFHTVQAAGRGAWDQVALITLFEELAHVLVRGPLR